MAARMTELEPRLIERLRAELAEVFAASVAYPAFFDFRTNRQTTRPIDQARMEEIQRYLNSANFSSIERTDITASDLRRFIERLILRYLDVNESLRSRYAARYLPRMRAMAPRIATDVQRRAIGYANGSVPDFGARRQAMSWTNQSRRDAKRSDEDRERATRVLEAALMQRSPAAEPEAKASTVAPDPWRALPNDVTVPVPAASFDNAPPAAPFAAFADQSNGASPSTYTVADQATGPMMAAPANPSRQAGPVPMRELPPDLYQLYGDYMSDMAPGAPAQPVAPPPTVPTPQRAAPQRPIGAPTNQSPQARNDQLIFWQLRYQLEAYIVRAARSYGVPYRGGDPASVLDALRQSGMVDESDLRIAEGIFALTDKVTASGSASDQEYRQALMLYLLYHRSHLNA